jgi:hypothetical protein
MKETVYLSGPISGCESVSKEIFAEAEKIYEDAGFFVLNPHNLGNILMARSIAHERGLPTPADYLAYDIHIMVMHADIIVLLPGWEDSYGCCQELTAAVAKNMRIRLFMHETDLVLDRSQFCVTFEWPDIYSTSRFFKRTIEKIFRPFIIYFLNHKTKKYETNRVPIL